MKRHSLILFLVGSLIVFSFESCVRSIEKVHSVELRKLDPTLQGVRKSFSNRQINDVSTWENVRKPELIDYYENYVFGKRPAFKPAVAYSILSVDTISIGGVRMVHTEIQASFKYRGRKMKSYFAKFLPLNVKDPIVFVGLNFFGNSTLDTLHSLTQSKHYVMKNAGVKTKGHHATEESRGTKAYRWPLDVIVGNGCGLITAHYADFDPDVNNGFVDGVHGLAEGRVHLRKRNEWGSISAWAWGLSELQTYLELQPETKKSKTVVIGHSRLGKAALWAGALDERFDMVISNNSGCAGAAQFRTMRGEDIEKITNRFPYWFARNFQSFRGNDSLLLVDQEMLLSLVAPRALYVASASKDSWADPQGEYLSFYKSQAIYALYDSTLEISYQYPSPNESIQFGNIAYHLRAGEHEILRWDWEKYVEFANKVLYSPSN
jgi:hypothetical protein